MPSNDGKDNLQNDAKTGANIAKSIATGNYAGAAKKAAKKGVKEAKSAISDPGAYIKKKLKRGLIKFGIPIIAIILIPIMFFGIIMEVGRIIKETLANIATKIASWITSWITIDGIKVSNNDVRDFIKELENQGISMSDMGMASDDSADTDTDADESITDDQTLTAEEKHAVKYIKKFLQAQLVTETTNLQDSGFIHWGTVDGGVYLQRHDAKTGDITTLKYKESSEFDDLINNNPTDAKKYYTRDDSGNVIYTDGSGSKKLTLSKTAYSKYSIPAMYFIDICLVTQNPEYAEALADDIIKQTNGRYLELTILDSCTETTTTITTREAGEGTDPVTRVNSTSREDYTSKIIITNINSLLYSISQTYSIDNGEAETKTLPKYDYMTSNTDYGPRIYVVSITTITTQTYGFTNPVKTDPYYNYHEDDNFYKETKETAYYEPYVGDSKIAYDSLINGGDIMFALMDSNLDNDTLEQIYKYVLYKMSDVNFGVTEEDSNWFNLNLFTDGTVNGNDFIVYTEAPGAAPVVTNRDQLIQGLTQWLSGQAQANAISVVDKVLEIQETYKINAVFIYGLLMDESTIGTANTSWVRENNWTSLTSLGHKQYASPQENLQTFVNKTICGSYYFALGKYSVQQIGETYCADPPPPAWANNVVGFMKDLYSACGISVSTGGSETAEDGDGYYATYTSSIGKTYKLYKQFMGSYRNKSFVNGGNVANSGCSITSVACVLSGYGHNVSPGDLVDESTMVAIAPKYNVSCSSDYETPDASRMTSGQPAIVSISGTLIVNGISKYYPGHYIAILDGRNGDEVYINDVGSTSPDQGGRGPGEGWANVSDIIAIVNRGVIYF